METLNQLHPVTQCVVVITIGTGACFLIVHFFKFLRGE